MPRLMGRINGAPVVAYPGTATGDGWYTWIPESNPFIDNCVKVNTLEDAAATLAIHAALLPDFFQHAECRCGSGECICECDHALALSPMIQKGE